MKIPAGSTSQVSWRLLATSIVALAALPNARSFTTNVANAQEALDDEGLADPAETPEPVAEPAPKDEAPEFKYEQLRLGPDVKVPIDKSNNWKSLGEIPAEDDKKFEEYFKFKIAELTWQKNLGKLASLRSAMNKTLKDASKADATTMIDRLHRMLLDELPVVATNKGYHPASRFNAVLLLADLSREYAEGANPNDPLPEAVEPLRKVLLDESQDTAIRVGAFDGLVRHALSEKIADASRRTIIQDAIKLVRQKTPPEGQNANGHLWLRNAAVQMLGKLASSTPDAGTSEVALALYEMAAEPELKIWHRCEAAAMLGAMPAESGLPAARIPEATKTLGMLAATLYKIVPVPAPKPVAAPKPAATPKADAAANGGAEKRPEEEDKPKPPKREKKTPTQARVQAGDNIDYYLNCVVHGLKGKSEKRGLYEKADQPTRELIDALVTKIEETKKQAKDKAIYEEADLRRKLAVKCRELGKLVGAEEKPAAAVAVKPAAPAIGNSPKNAAAATVNSNP